jgi:hypothetical protein
MDRERLKRQLDEAEENVARSVQHVAEQWNLPSAPENGTPDMSHGDPRGVGGGSQSD